MRGEKVKIEADLVVLATGMQPSLNGNFPDKSIIDENGFIKKEYAADEVHLNTKIVPFARDRIVEAFGGRKNFTKTLNHTTKR